MRKVTFINSKGESILLTSAVPFILYKIEGSGCPKTTNYISEAPFQDGGEDVGESIAARQLFMEIGIVASTPEEKMRLRSKMLSIFNPRLGVGILQYEYDGGIKIIHSKIDSGPEFPGGKENCSPIFQRALITLLCPNPFWLDTYESKEEIALWTGEFEFPLEIPEEGIQMGYRESNLIVNVFNKGDVECSMRIEFTALASVVNPSLFNVNTREYIKIKRTLQAGDKLLIDTDPNKTSVELIRNEVKSNVFNYIDLDSTFLKLKTGDNLFRYDAEGGIDNLEASIYYRPQYVGV